MNLNSDMHFNTSTDMGLVIAMVVMGLSHGLTPHGHSWLVLLPFALGGVTTRTMLRMSLAYSLGFTLTSAAIGALLGLLASRIPYIWHVKVEGAIGLALLLVGLSFLLKPLSIHHAIDHLCGEECASREEKALVRSGTTGAMFMLGVMSILIPCPTVFPAFTLLIDTHSALKSMLLFTLFALSTAVAINLVAVAMVYARGLVTILDQRGFRLFILRFSGVLVLGIGGWMLWTSLHAKNVQPVPEHTIFPARVIPTACMIDSPLSSRFQVLSSGQTNSLNVTPCTLNYSSSSRNQSRTVRPCTTSSGAISASGASTKRRCVIYGCGRRNSGVSRGSPG